MPRSFSLPSPTPKQLPRLREREKAFRALSFWKWKRERRRARALAGRGPVNQQRVRAGQRAPLPAAPRPRSRHDKTAIINALGKARWDQRVLRRPTRVTQDMICKGGGPSIGLTVHWCLNQLDLVHFWFGFKTGRERSL